MLIGCCVNILPKEEGASGIEYAPLLKAAGFDYIELPIARTALCGDEEFRDIKNLLGSLHLPVHACNNFFPPGIKLTGPEVDKGKVRESYARILERASELGIKVAVLGSPWAKNCPEGFPRKQAFDQMAGWCAEIGPEAAKKGILIALEPNNHTETNMINTYDEAAALAKAVSHPNIRCLQDYYHMKIENDHPSTMLKYEPDLLVHTHFARIRGRGFPVSAEEDAEYSEFFRVLREMGYEGGVSMEGIPQSIRSLPAEAEASCRLLKALAAGDFR